MNPCKRAKEWRDIRRMLRRTKRSIKTIEQSNVVHASMFDARDLVNRQATASNSKTNEEQER